MVRSVNSMNMGLLLHFFCSEMSPLIGSNAMWEAMMVDEAFYKTLDDGFVRSFACREVKLPSRASIYSSKNNMLPLP